MEGRLCSSDSLCLPSRRGTDDQCGARFARCGDNTNKKEDAQSVAHAWFVSKTKPSEEETKVYMYFIKSTRVHGRKNIEFMMKHNDAFPLLMRDSLVRPSPTHHNQHPRPLFHSSEVSSDIPTVPCKNASTIFRLHSSSTDAHSDRSRQ